MIAPASITLSKPFSLSISLLQLPIRLFPLEEPVFFVRLTGASIEGPLLWVQMFRHYLWDNLFVVLISHVGVAR